MFANRFTGLIDARRLGGIRREPRSAHVSAGDVWFSRVGDRPCVIGNRKAPEHCNGVLIAERIHPFHVEIWL